MKKLKVLVISNFYPPHYIGGYELGCRDVVEGLKAEDVRSGCLQAPMGWASLSVMGKSTDGCNLAWAGRSTGELNSPDYSERKSIIKRLSNAFVRFLTLM